MSISPERFEKILAVLTNQLVWGSLHFRTARQIREALREKSEDLAHCRWPLDITQIAHYDNAVAVLMRLLSRDSQSVTIYKLLRVCRSNPGLFARIEQRDLAGMIDQDELLLEGMADILGRLKEERDSRFAHLDSSLLEEAHTGLGGQRVLNFDWKEADELYEKIQRLIIKYYELYHDVDLDIKLGENSFGWMLSVLETEGRRHREERERFHAEHVT